MLLLLGAVTAVTTVNASTDYGPAYWRPPCNANYNTSGYGHKFHVIHDMEGYYLSVISMFNACGYTSASVHYLINGKQDSSSDAAAGEVTQSIRDSYYAWHVRCWNSYCTGTEHEGFASNPAWYTSAMYEASAGVTRHLSSRFGWAKDRNHVIGHNQESVSGWPSYASANFGIDPYCNSHTDPGPYWNWTSYMSLVTSGGGAGVKDGVLVFSRSSSGSVVYKSYANGAGWGPVIDIGGSVTGGVGVCSRNPDEVLVFTRGSALNNLQQISYTTTDGWGDWVGLGGNITSDPTAIAWGSNGTGVLVFARSSTGTVVYKSYSGGSWGPWIDIGGSITGGVAVCSRNSSEVIVFARGSALNNLQQISYSTTTGWGNWVGLGGNITSDPACIARSATNIEVFARSSSGTLIQKSYNSGWEPNWIDLGGSITDGPSVTARSSTEVLVFTRGSSLNNLQQKSYTTTTGWGDWIGLGGTISSGPEAMAW